MLSNQVIPIPTPPYFLALSDHSISLTPQNIRYTRSVFRVRHWWRVLVNVQDHRRLIVLDIVKAFGIIPEYLNLVNKVGTAELPLVLEEEVASP